MLRIHQLLKKANLDFEAMDTNKDGIISAEEAGLALAASGCFTETDIRLILEWSKNTFINIGSWHTLWS